MPEREPHQDGGSADAGFVDVGFARLDVDRARRTGDPEVVFGQGKTPEQIVTALTTLHATHPERAILATRLDGQAGDAIRLALPDADVDDVSRTAVLGPLPAPSGRVLVVAAGTSDGPVAAEAMITARVHGTSAERVDDVGVAGLHRLLAVRDRLDQADALVVVAGMEGALPSVVGGLTGVPLVAVPTSIGYGTGAGGLAALLSMLNSCAPGIAVVNVDNGYGAGVHAARIARQGRALGRFVIWIDASSGASGDMLLAALHDLGVPAHVMTDAARAVAPVEITFDREVRHGFAVGRAYVRGVEDDVPHRTWVDVRSLLDGASMDEAVRSRAHEVFARLAEAEGLVHGTSADDVHFHEVGAHDAIGDVVGVCAGFGWLGDQVCVGPIALGGGTARSAHGEIPVPVPAVLNLLTGAGAPAHGGPVEVELCTPTGAALLTTLAEAYGPMPAMAVTATGSGAGSRILPGRHGALRMVRGERTDVEHADVERTDAVVLETNVDDLDPRVWPQVLARLLDEGASDAWLTPILMKKGRPAHTLHVLCPHDGAVQARLERTVFTETSAIGLRVVPVSKTALSRTETTLDVGGQPVRVKLALLDGRVVNAQPEHDDVLAAAAATGVPLKTLLARATAAATELLA